MRTTDDRAIGKHNAIADRVHDATVHLRLIPAVSRGDQETAREALLRVDGILTGFLRDADNRPAPRRGSSRRSGSGDQIGRLAMTFGTMIGSSVQARRRLALNSATTAPITEP